MNDCALQRQLMAVRFYIWDLHLYLDTHPCDATAIELLKKYKEKSKEIQERYEAEFGPINMMSGFGNKWLKAPWPWVRECDC